MVKNFTSYSFQPPFASCEGDVCLLSGAAWLADIQALHAASRIGDRAAFLMPRDDQYFTNLLTGKTGFMFGILIDSELVAMAALVVEENVSTAKQNKNLTFPDGLIDEDSLFQQAKIGVFQSVCVSPKHAGKGFAGHLIQTALILGQEHGCAHVLAQVATHNAIGVHQFKKHNFQPACSWQKEHGRFLFHHAVEKIANDRVVLRRQSRRA